MVALATQMTVVTAGAVLVVLVLGLWNMARRHSSPSLSQTLMRWRVGLQFIAILIAMLALYVVK